MSDLPLSQQLISDVDAMDREYDRDVPAHEQEEHERTKRIVQALTKHLVDSRETFLEKPIAVLDQLAHSNREIVEHLIDDYYTRQQLDKISSFVRRTLNLSQFETTHIPSEQTRTYVREARRTYIYGLSQATIALCRAAVEQCLKERLGRQGDGRYLESRRKLGNMHDNRNRASRPGTLILEETTETTNQLGTCARKAPSLALWMSQDIAMLVD
jgi:hypothetical protein